MTAASAYADAAALQKSDLNGFLFAELGQEATGMPISVLSAFARLGMDPWAEAGRLAKLPRAAAVDGLARLIAALPAGRWSLPDATPIAARLVALLPARGGSAAVASVAAAPVGTRAGRQWAIGALLLALAFAGLVVSMTRQPETSSDTQPLTSLKVPAATVPTSK